MLSFLGLPIEGVATLRAPLKSYSLLHGDALRAAKAEPMQPATREVAEAFYRPYNQVEPRTQTRGSRARPCVRPLPATARPLPVTSLPRFTPQALAALVGNPQLAWPKSTVVEGLSRRAPA